MIDPTGPTEQPEPTGQPRDLPRWRARLGGAGRQLAVVGVGLGIGIAVVVSVGHRSHRLPPPTPSVTRFSFEAAPPAAPPVPEVVEPPAIEPPDASSALAAVLTPLVEGHPEMAYPLLDEASRVRYPTLAAWIRAQADRPQPLAFEIGEARPASGGDEEVFDVDLAATHAPSLDPYRGLVPARSRSTWLVRREPAGWRVGADPLSFDAVMPPDASAAPVVQDWVSRLAACDTVGAGALQVDSHLYGPTRLAEQPCQSGGSWSAGGAGAFDQASDPRAFLAAFGPDVATWARLVPVSGPAGRFLVAVAPWDDGWKVMGVAASD